MKRILSVALVIVAISAGLSAPAQAAANHLMVNLRSGNCLTFSNPVFASPCNGSATQRWNTITVGRVGGRDLVQIQNPQSTNCIRIAGNGTSSGTLLVPDLCSTAQQVLWVAIPDAFSIPGVYFFANYYVSLRGLTRVIDENVSVRIWTSNGSDAQKFALVP